MSNNNNNNGNKRLSFAESKLLIESLKKELSNLKEKLSNKFEYLSRQNLLKINKELEESIKNKLSPLKNFEIENMIYPKLNAYMQALHQFLNVIPKEGSTNEENGENDSKKLNNLHINILFCISELEKEMVKAKKKQNKTKKKKMATLFNYTLNLLTSKDSKTKKPKTSREESKNKKGEIEELREIEENKLIVDENEPEIWKILKPNDLNENNEEQESTTTTTNDKHDKQLSQATKQLKKNYSFDSNIEEEIIIPISLPKKNANSHYDPALDLKKYLVWDVKFNETEISNIILEFFRQLDSMQIPKQISKAKVKSFFFILVFIIKSN